MDAVVIVHDRNRELDHAKRRAIRNRRRQIEAMVVTLKRLVIAAGLLMLFAGACVIDTAPELATELTGWLMMLGGLLVASVAMMMIDTKEDL